VELKNSAGDSATIYQFGACVTSYVKGGTDYLMVRPDAKMDGSKPISGGIPFCFPQFGPGAIQQHGFARNLDWDIAEQTDDMVVFTLRENDYTMEMWPYKFLATYTVTLAGDSLKTDFSVTNTDSKAFDFTAALHSYWSVEDIDGVKVSSPSFNGATYLDKMQSPPADVVSKSDSITIKGETDSVYAGVSGDVVLADAKRKSPLTISNTLGWADTVIWNPYGSEAMGYKNFICVESGVAAAPVRLEPGEYWTGAMNVVP
jgi:glucose-6-phosphate 1-epimerase